MLNLEKKERAIIIFLSMTLLLGSGIIYYKKLHRPHGIEIKDIGRAEAMIAQKELININTASIEELTRLKGIGNEIAKRIADYRDSKGYFRSKEEIKNVKGIGEVMYDRIKDDISIE